MSAHLFMGIVMPKSSSLTSEEIHAFRNHLLDLRARLRGDVTAIAENALSKGEPEAVSKTSMPIHMAEAGSDNFEQEFSLSLMMSGRDTLDKVEKALQRIEAGTFGLCESCSTSIPKGRLRALPFAARCVKCAETAEQNQPPRR